MLAPPYQPEPCALASEPVRPASAARPSMTDVFEKFHICFLVLRCEGFKEPAH